MDAAASDQPAVRSAIAAALMPYGPGPLPTMDTPTGPRPAPDPQADAAPPPAAPARAPAPAPAHASAPVPAPTPAHGCDPVLAPASAPARVPSAAPVLPPAPAPDPFRAVVPASGLSAPPVPPPIPLGPEPADALVRERRPLRAPAALPSREELLVREARARLTRAGLSARISADIVAHFGQPVGAPAASPVPPVETLLLRDHLIAAGISRGLAHDLLDLLIDPFRAGVGEPGPPLPLATIEALVSEVRAAPVPARLAETLTALLTLLPARLRPAVSAPSR
jgi:hypothetical protein